MIYTVILKYPDYLSDGDAYFTEHTQAARAQDAAEQVRLCAAADCDCDAPDDFAVVAVFAGQHTTLPAE